MKFKNKSFYLDFNSRPKTHSYLNEENGILIILTHWGSKIDIKECFQLIESYIVLSESDEEVTSPFISLDDLTKKENSLRTSLLLLNSHLYHKYNKYSLKLGLEVSVCYFKNQELVISSFGQPHVLYFDETNHLQNLFLNGDYSNKYSKELALAPLPSKLIGTSESIEIQVMTLKNSKTIYFLNHSWIPEILFSRPSTNFESWAKVISEEQVQSAWLGQLDLSL